MIIKCCGMSDRRGRVKTLPYIASIHLSFMRWTNLVRSFSVQTIISSLFSLPSSLHSVLSNRFIVFPSRVTVSSHMAAGRVQSSFVPYSAR